MENSNRLIEEEVKKFHDKVEELRAIEIEEAVESPVVDFGCKIRQGDYVWKIVDFKKFFRSSLEKVRQETIEIMWQQYHNTNEPYKTIWEIRDEARQETLKEMESKLPNTIKEVCYHNNNSSYCDSSCIGVRESTLSEVRKIISELKK